MIAMLRLAYVKKLNIYNEPDYFNASTIYPHVYFYKINKFLF